MTDAATRDTEARAILANNDRGGYTVPTHGLYPYQWNWDSVFAAAGFAEHDMDRAWTEIETLFSGQWDNGMVPHILFHQVDPGYFPGPDIWRGTGPIPSSGISQPPIAATFVRWLLDKDAAFEPRARALLPKLMASHRWFMDWRNEDGAIVVTHPWETGRDNCPDWDAPFAAIEPEGVDAYYRRDTTHVVEEERPRRWDYDRYLHLVKLGGDCGWDEAHLRQVTPFRVADPTMTFTLLRASRDLRDLAARLGEPTAEIDGWIASMERGAETLWNDDAQTYDCLDIRSGKHTGVISNASFLCWFAGLGNDRMLAHYDRIAAAETFFVPSTDPAHPAYEPKRYWRGPVWAMMNMLIATGLGEAGHVDRAEALTENTRRLIAENGFAEYFDPRDGAPAGGRNFTWTAAVWLAWASPTTGGTPWARSS
ncbi:MGH1-like glycoside hydrolase domain-containing protein [Marinibacterium sp. SX1]|uniref:MGH1-like glycoside hydrolase domain-containing protein n=1 Tax=Marinibacterium sp. SX1 TaxID=3388424 RepID=UPI003D164A77